MACIPVWQKLDKGGQTAANKALAALDIRGYAKKRSEVLPVTGTGSQCAVGVYSPQHPVSSGSLGQR